MITMTPNNIDELIKRLSRYTPQTIAEYTDCDFANAITDAISALNTRKIREDYYKGIIDKQDDRIESMSSSLRTIIKIAETEFIGNE